MKADDIWCMRVARSSVVLYRNESALFFYRTRLERLDRAWARSSSSERASLLIPPLADDKYTYFVEFLFFSLNAGFSTINHDETAKTRTAGIADHFQSDRVNKMKLYTGIW